MAGGTPRVPDLVLEKFVLEELSSERMSEIEALAAAEPEIAARIAEIRRSNEEILGQYPVDKVALDIRAQAGAAPPAANNRRAWTAGIVGIAMAALALFFVMPNTGDVGLGPDGVELTRTKGVLAPELVVLRKGEDGTGRLGPSDTVADGDRIQVGYLAGGARHGVIGVMDGTGAVAILHPRDRDDRLEGGGEIMLPQAMELDGPGGFLRVVLVADDVPVDIDAVRSALEGAADEADPARAELDLPGRPVVLDTLLLEQP